ncbi:MAG: hypothetical protein HY720_23275 [Planctomycetes bacterium]|nr:hypothetical protein [Planctomycetota bacterium]
MNAMRRALPWLAAAAYFAGTVAWLARDPRVAKEVFDEDSIHNTGGPGSSLAYGYLRRRLGADRVRELTRPLERSGVAPDAVVFRLGPEPAGRTFLDTHQEDFARGGGRLVLALEEGDYGDLEVGSRDAGEIEKVAPVWPGVERIVAKGQHVLSGPALSRGQAVLVRGDDIFAARFPMGEGEVLVFASPVIFRNAGLAEGDHLALLSALAGTGRPVYFDEAAHGLASEIGPVEILRDWGLGPLVALAALTGTILFWRRASRVGLPDHGPGETRTEAVELVDSLAGLYHRALSPQDALRLHRKNLEREVATAFGLSGAALEAKMRELLTGPAPSQAPPSGKKSRPRRARGRRAFRHELDRMNQAYRMIEDAKCR